MNMGTAGGNNGASVGSAKWLGLGIPTDENLPDQLAISFWQKVSATPDSSSFWANSPSSNNGQRGFQAHVPWSNGEIYFDSAGCCDAGAQRVNGPGGIMLDTWEHYVFQKKGGVKEVWQNGILLLTSEGANRLANDFTKLSIGSADGNNAIRGLIDDFAVFGEFLTPAQVASLAGGASPPSLVAPPVTVFTDSISSITPSGNNLIIAFRPTNPAGIYKLARSPNQLNWTVLTDVPMVAGGIVTFTTAKPAGDTKNYYRIVK